MEHLTDREIFGFAHISSYDGDSVRLVGAVNRHIMVCRECAEKVSLTVRYYDAVGAIVEGALPLSSGYGISREQISSAAVRHAAERNVY